MAEMKENYEKELKDVFEREGKKGLIEHTTNVLEKWKSVKIKIAVTGSSGAGKSSLINALRGIDRRDKNAAKEGVTETTTTITCYAFPDNDQIELYDLPGVGTLSQPIETYVSEMDFKHYHFVVIVSSERFSQTDGLLAKELHRLQIPFYLVRSKVKADVDNQDGLQGRDEVLAVIRDYCVSNLKKLGVEAKEVFLIDSHVRNDFELGKLQLRLVEDAPDSFKNALIYTFRNTTKEVIAEKVTFLRKRVKLTALKASLFIVIPGAEYFFDVNVISEEIEFYKQQLDIDDDALGRIFYVSKVDETELNLHEKLVVFFRRCRDCYENKTNVKGIGFEYLLSAIEHVVLGVATNFPKVYAGLNLCLDKLEIASLEKLQNI